MTVGPIDYKYIGFRSDLEDEVLALLNEKRTEEGLPPFKLDSELQDYARQSLTEGKEILPADRTASHLFFHYNRGSKETADYLPWKSDIFLLKHEDGSPYYTSIGIACYHHFVFPESAHSVYAETPKYLNWCFILGAD